MHPSHVDRKIKFQLADEDMVARFFCFMYDSELGNALATLFRMTAFRATMPKKREYLS
jgi:hypothetical protein